MIRYFPIRHEPDFNCLYSDMAKLEWFGSGITADFVLEDPGKLFRVRFKDVYIIRVLDEFPLSLEESESVLEESGSVGLVPYHFAYRVEGAPFWNSQSDVFLEINPELRHYRFITGNTCLDVLSKEEPTFEIIEANKG